MSAFFGEDMAFAERAAYENMRSAMDAGDLEGVLDWAGVVLKLRGRLERLVLQSVEMGDPVRARQWIDAIDGGCTE